MAVATGLYKIFLKILEMRQDKSKRGQDQEDKVRNEQADRIKYLEGENKSLMESREALVAKAAISDTLKEQLAEERARSKSWEEMYRNAQMGLLGYVGLAELLNNPEGREFLKKQAALQKPPPPPPP